MSWKLLRWFVNQDIPLVPLPAPEVLELAHFMRGTDSGPYPLRRFPYDLRAVMRKLFLSKYFFDAANRFAMIKTPVDYVIMALRVLGFGESFTGSQGPADRIGRMGMNLFQPPNVAGWNHGRSWITSANTIQRFNYANRVGQVLLKTTEGIAYLDGLLAPPARLRTCSIMTG